MTEVMTGARSGGTVSGGKSMTHGNLGIGQCRSISISLEYLPARYAWCRHRPEPAWHCDSLTRSRCQIRRGSIGKEKPSADDRPIGVASRVRVCICKGS